MLTRFLSWLVYLANANPPYGWQSPCRRIKAIILSRFWRRDGDDWQYLDDPCWECSGTGDAGYGYGCDRCDDTGVYRQRWVRLERWRLGPRVFHRPAETVYAPPREAVAIRGRVRHDDVGQAGHEAALWLAMVFEFESFHWMLLDDNWIAYRSWRYPLCLLHEILVARRRRTGHPS